MPTDKVSGRKGNADGPASESGGTDHEEDRPQLERRVAQLLGERDALRRQVSELLAQNKQTQKDLGAATERLRLSEERRPPRLGATLRHAVNGVQRADVRGWFRLKGKTESSPSRPRAPSNRSPDALIPFHDAEGGGRAVLGVTLMGVAADALPGVLDIIARESDAKGLTPVIVTDTADFAPFRARHLIVEYIPPPAARQRFAPDLPWDLYLRRRLTLFRQKWAPVAIVSYGRPPVEWPELVGPGAASESADAG